MNCQRKTYSARQGARQDEKAAREGAKAQRDLCFRVSFRTRRARKSVLGTVLAVLAALAAPAHGQVLVKKVLFFDEDDVFYRSGTKQVLFSLAKHDAVTGASSIDPVLKPDSWDTGASFSLCSVSYDAARSPKYMMWYQVDSSAKGFTGADRRYSNVVAYATSNDGLTWTKPNLRSTTGFTYPVGSGATNNNIVLTGLGSAFGDRSGCSVLYDPAEADASRRYKMIFTDWADTLDPSRGIGLQVAFSSNGIQWAKQPDGPLQKIGFNHKDVPVPVAGAQAYNDIGTQWNIPATLSDALNVFQDAGQYIVYGRMPMDGPTGTMDWKRGMGRTSSADFLAWSTPEFLFSPGDGDANASFQDSPVFRYEGFYLCLNQLRDTASETTEIELLSSRDGWHWNRFRKIDYGNVEVLARGPVIGGTPRDFDSKFLYTNSSLVAVGDDLRVYYGGQGNGSGIGLAQTKRDRLVGIKAYWTWRDFDDPTPIDPTGQVTLTPIDMSNLSTLKINAKVESGGSIKAELLTPDSYRLTNFTTDKSTAITGDSVEKEVKWGASTLANVPDGKYMVRFSLVKATLYSCSFYAPNGTAQPTPTPSPTPLPLVTPVMANFVSARSTLSHNGVSYDIALPAEGPAGVETRKGAGDGSEYTIVMRFDQDLVSGSATASTGSVTSAEISPVDAKELIVKLSGVANARITEINASVNTPSGGTGTGKISAGFLLGDINGDGAVNVADVGMVNSKRGLPVSESTKLSDVNCDGRIDSQDVGLVHGKSPSRLSP